MYRVAPALSASGRVTKALRKSRTERLEDRMKKVMIYLLNEVPDAAGVDLFSEFADSTESIGQLALWQIKVSFAMLINPLEIHELL